MASALPPTAAEEVADILARFRLNAPADLYNALKKVHLARTAPSERTRMQQLLSGKELGDHRPRQLLRRLMQLLGSRAHTVDNTPLQELFFQRFPANVQMVLASALIMDLATLADFADKIMKVETELATVSSPTTTASASAATLLSTPEH